MSPRLVALKYILEKARYQVDELKYFKDTNEFPISNLDQQKLKGMIDLCKDIVEEMMLP